MDEDKLINNVNLNNSRCEQKSNGIFLATQLSYLMSGLINTRWKRENLSV